MGLEAEKVCEAGSVVERRDLMEPLVVMQLDLLVGVEGTREVGGTAEDGQDEVADDPSVALVRDVAVAKGGRVQGLLDQPLVSLHPPGRASDHAR